MKNAYFFKLYTYDKRLFSLVVAFSVFTIFFNVRGDEVTPFFVWGMYSEKEPIKPRYEILRITITGNKTVDYTSGYTDNNRFFLQEPLLYFRRTIANNSIDPSLTFLKGKLGKLYEHLRPLTDKAFNKSGDLKYFMNWYKRYLEQTTGQAVNKLDIDVLSGRFSTSGRILIDSSVSLYKWKQ